VNPHLCRVVLRPRGPFEVFDLGYRFMRERFWPLARMGVVVLLPPWLALSVAAWWFEGNLLVLVPAILIGPVLQAPFTLLAGRLLFNEKVRVREVLWDVVRQTPALLGTWAVAILGWTLAAFTCFVGLPWVQGALLYLSETALLERVGPQRGLRRTLRLAAGQFGGTAVGLLAKWLLVIWFGLMGEAVGQAVVGFILQLGAPLGSLMTLQATPWLLGGVLVSQPIYAVYRLFLYVDVRTRVEGWDLQVGLRAAGLAE
jgi:hypothetical protein